jgi:hypothetical protein
MQKKKSAGTQVIKILKGLNTLGLSERNLLFEQAIAISSFLSKIAPVRTLEIGLDLGVFACGVMGTTKARHVAIDPYQKVIYKNAGLENAVGSGFGRKIEFYEGYSQLVLPHLWRRKRKFDFILINGDKKFDMYLMDFLLADHILEVGGHVYLNCTWMPSVKKVEELILIQKKNEYSLQKKIHGSGTLFKKIKEIR